MKRLHLYLSDILTVTAWLVNMAFIWWPQWWP